MKALQWKNNNFTNIRRLLWLSRGLTLLQVDGSGLVRIELARLPGFRVVQGHRLILRRTLRRRLSFRLSLRSDFGEGSARGRDLGSRHILNHA